MSIYTHILSNYEYETKKGIKAHHKGIENQKTIETFLLGSLSSPEEQQRVWLGRVWKQEPGSHFRCFTQNLNIR